MSLLASTFSYLAPSLGRTFREKLRASQTSFLLHYSFVHHSPQQEHRSFERLTWKREVSPSPTCSCYRPVFAFPLHCFRLPPGRCRYHPFPSVVLSLLPHGLSQSLLWTLCLSSALLPLLSNLVQAFWASRCKSSILITRRK